MYIVPHGGRGTAAFINGARLIKDSLGFGTQGPDVLEALFNLYGPRKLPVELPFPNDLWPKPILEVPLLESHEQTNVSGAAASGGSEEAKK
jgi:hypothetical protein